MPVCLPLKGEAYRVAECQDLGGSLLVRTASPHAWGGEWLPWARAGLGRACAHARRGGWPRRRSAWRRLAGLGLAGGALLLRSALFCSGAGFLAGRSLLGSPFCFLRLLRFLRHQSPPERFELQ